jgi:hypothetical protein
MHSWFKVHLVLCEKKQVSIIFGSGLWKYLYPFHFFFLWHPIWKMQNNVELLMDLNPELKLTTHLYQVPWLRMVELYLH